MIFGTVEIGAGVLHTHNHSYALTRNTNFSAPRPFRASGIGVAVLISAFGFAFRDLLYPMEICVVAGCAIAAFGLGNSIAHLLIINKDLRGSDSSVAVWGTYRHLSLIRRQLADAVGATDARIAS